jgi:hypothetical protein
MLCNFVICILNVYPFICSNSKGSRKAIFATRKSPDELIGSSRNKDSDLLVRRIREMSNRERPVLGDKLLRDTLTSMTTMYVKTFLSGSRSAPSPLSYSIPVVLPTVVLKKRRIANDVVDNSSLVPPIQSAKEELMSRLVSCFSVESVPWILYWCSCGLVMYLYLHGGYPPSVVLTVNTMII